MSVTLRNPHSVAAALRVRPHDVLEVVLPPRGGSEAWQEVERLARDQHLPVRVAMPQALAGRGDRRGAEKQERLGAGQATIRERTGLGLEELFTPAEALEGEFGVWLALDCLQDPHNVGAIMRTAAFFRVQGVLLTRDRSAPLSGTVYDVSAGGMESVRFAQPSNLNQAFEVARQKGLWILGASEHMEKPLSQIPLDRHWLLVVGNEESGLRQLTMKSCDELCAIPPRGAVGSLNVSVATGILLAHLCR